jgi:hypothetical protein
MAALVFDAGALIALDRRDRDLYALVALAAQQGIEAITSSAIVAQVWRDPARQARLTTALQGFKEFAVDQLAARRCGLLLADTYTSDIADAALVLLVHDGDTVLTSDPGDIQRLLDSAKVNALVHVV